MTICYFLCTVIHKKRATETPAQREEIMTTTATLTAEQQRFEDLTPEMDSSYGPGYTDAVRRSFTELHTAEARSLFLSTIGNKATRDSHNSKPSRAEDWERVAALGYTDWATFNGLNLGTILHHNITADRLPVVAHLLATYGSTTPKGKWDADALTNAPLERLAASLQEHKSPYVALAAASDLGDLDRISECLAAGIKSVELIESGVPVDTILDIQKHLKSLGAREILAIAATGLTGIEAKGFGAIASLRYSREELLSSPLKPAVIRGLSSAYPYGHEHTPSMAQLAALHGAGFTGRAAVYTMTEAFGLRKNDARDIKALVAIGKKISAADLAAVSFIHRRDTLLPRDAAAIRTLVRGGITSKEAAEKLGSQIYARSQGTDQPDREHGLTIHELLASLVAAKITPERIGVLSRAGIPASRMKDFAKSTTEWADGEPFRADVVVREERLSRFSYRPEPVAPWEFTAENFRQS